MISFSQLDITIIVAFFTLVVFVGFTAGKQLKDTEGYLLSGRKIGLLFFVLTNVATWYGGILGVGEFTYRYGLLSWITQGLPYYIFAILFAIFFAKKIQAASLFTIPEKLTSTYGKKIGVLSSILIFILVSPAPYLLMIGSLIAQVFGINIIWGLVIGIIVSIVYLFGGGYRSNIYTDALQFFVMFLGFGIIFYFSITRLGDFSFLEQNLPNEFLSIFGNTSPTFIIVWFLIALWTFADPGFHQRCYSAKNGNVAKNGIIISVFLWILFDFLTTSTGLYAKAALPDLKNPVLSFPIFAEYLLPSGLKGIFYAALFATILSTLNSFMFLSATTIGRDFLIKFIQKDIDFSIRYTQIGILITAVISFILSLIFKSVVEIWYVIGSICIPGIILPVFGSYFKIFRINSFFILIEIIVSTGTAAIWFFIRSAVINYTILYEIEPMIIGLLFGLTIHLFGIFRRRKEILH